MEGKEQLPRRNDNQLAANCKFAINDAKDNGGYLQSVTGKSRILYPN